MEPYTEQELYDLEHDRDWERFVAEEEARRVYEMEHDVEHIVRFDTTERIRLRHYSQIEDWDFVED